MGSLVRPRPLPVKYLLIILFLIETNLFLLYNRLHDEPAVWNDSIDENKRWNRFETLPFVFSGVEEDVMEMLRSDRGMLESFEELLANSNSKLIGLSNLLERKWLLYRPVSCCSFYQCDNTSNELIRFWTDYSHQCRAMTELGSMAMYVTTQLENDRGGPSGDRVVCDRAGPKRRPSGMWHSGALAVSEPTSRQHQELSVQNISRHITSRNK